MWIYTIIILLILVSDIRTDCEYSSNILTCQESSLEQVEYILYGNKNLISNIEIVNTKYNSIDKFLDALDKSRKDRIETIKLTNNEVMSIGQNAFKDYENLKLLDLASNKIETILFVSSLPQGINKLVLKNNSIVQLDDVFKNLKDLYVLDLSFCKLQNVDFTLFKDNLNLVLVNVSSNGMQVSTSKELVKNIQCVDISHNNLTKYENIPSFCLNFSYTYIPGYRWFNVSDKNRTVFVDSFYYKGNTKLVLNATNVKENLLNIEIGYLDLSEFKSNISELELTKVKVVKELIIKDSYIPLLDKSIYNFQELLYSNSSNVYLDMSNCSIDDISESYFEAYYIRRLNLCYNNITNFKDGVFRNAFIQQLDLCHSGIQFISDDAFSDISVLFLNLSNNHLNSINFLGKVNTVKEVDLSFNMLEMLTTEVLSKLIDLEIIDVSNNLLSSFHEGAFSGGKLKIINLMNNKLTSIKSISFNNLPNLNQILLQGNAIVTIESNAFEFLPGLNVLYLNDLGIRILQPQAFNDLKNLEIVHLNNNNITVLPENVFVKVPCLKTIYLQRNNITSVQSLSSLRLNLLQVSVDDSFYGFRLAGLKHLHISDSNIDTLKNSYFLGLYNLNELHFQGSSLDFIEVGALDGLFNLQYVSPHLFKRVTVLKRYTFKDLSLLNTLNLSGLALEVIEPGAFLGMSSLYNLMLSNNNISSISEFTFSGIDGLAILDLSKNEISKIYVKSFEGLNNLQKLNLNQNNISAIPVGLLQCLSNLEDLNVGNNQIEVITIGAFSNLRYLKALDLSFNRLSTICSGILFPLENLKSLNLEGNYLLGLNDVVVPNILPKLEYISFNNNNFSCNNLIDVLFKCKVMNITVSLQGQAYESENIDGIMCRSQCV